jgi:hypothetical protein
MPKQKRKTRKIRKKTKSKGVATPPIPDESRQAAALLYLRQWEENREAWSFKKKLQYWLMNNAYDKHKISRSEYKILLSYLKGLKGFHYSRLLDQAHKITSKYDEQDDDDSESSMRIGKTQYKRARKMIKTLSQ